MTRQFFAVFCSHLVFNGSPYFFMQSLGVFGFSRIPDDFL